MTVTLVMHYAKAQCCQSTTITYNYTTFDLTNKYEIVNPLSLNCQCLAKIPRNDICKWVCDFPEIFVYMTKNYISFQMLKFLLKPYLR